MKHYQLNTDKKIYNTLQQNFVLLEHGYDSYSGENKRGDFTYENLLKLGLSDISGSIQNYLDIGTGSGVIPDVIAKRMNIDSNHVYAIDIDNNEFVFQGKSNFIYYNGVKIPFDGVQFDMITAFMVFHHVKKNSLEILLKEIHRRLSDNGILIIKEHDYEPELENYIDVEHDIYELIRSQTFIDDHQCNYYTSQEMIDFIEKCGFQLYSRTSQQKTEKSPSKAYHAIFRKQISF
jgi:SAM-dependent methyltransferase